MADDRDEQVGDTGSAHIAERSELLAIGMIEEQDATTQQLTLVDWPESTGCSGAIGIHHHFQVSRLNVLHAAVEYDAPAVDEQNVGENVLNFFDLVCGDENGAAAIEVIVQEGVVKLLAKQDVETDGWLVENQQPRVDGHDQSEM